jgi:hypothetical protein
MDHLREVTLKTPGIFRWQILTITAGVALLVLGYDLSYHALWAVTGVGMIAKGLFLWLGPVAFRDQVIKWIVAREDVDYRLIGIGLCTLAMLLLDALGWIGQAGEE